MHTTKTEILAHLKRSDGATVDGIASSLNLAPMTVRQHLTALERDGVVRAQEVRRATGRPHFKYQLTEDGHRRLSDGYDRLLSLLVEQAGIAEPNGHGPSGRREALFRSAAMALAERMAPELRHLPLAEQVERAVAALSRHGGFAEYHQLDDAFEVRDFGCVYRELVTRTGSCAWHETFLSSALNAEVSTAADSAECAVCCRFIVRTRATVAAYDRKDTL
jgi:predicted ArsR family transcriptional regulator